MNFSNLQLVAKSCFIYPALIKQQSRLLGKLSCFHMQLQKHSSQPINANVPKHMIVMSSMYFRKYDYFQLYIVCMQLEEKVL